MIAGFFSDGKTKTKKQFAEELYLCYREMKQGGPAENPGTLNRTIMYEEDYYYEREQTYERYNGSYAQDVEGWSDQDIDDVFEGDPEAYWNID